MEFLHEMVLYLILRAIAKRMLPGLIAVPIGGECLLVDPGVQCGNTYQYRLIEQEGKGATHTYGPCTLETP